MDVSYVEIDIQWLHLILMRQVTNRSTNENVGLALHNRNSRIQTYKSCYASDYFLLFLINRSQANPCKLITCLLIYGNAMKREKKAHPPAYSTRTLSGITCCSRMKANAYTLTQNRSCFGGSSTSIWQQLSCVYWKSLDLIEPPTVFYSPVENDRTRVSRFLA